MGHCGEFGDVLLFTGAMVIRYEPRRGMKPGRGMKPYKNICDDFCTLDQSAGFSYMVLWALAQSCLIMQYRMGHRALLILITQNHTPIF
jgi:hypothetical protein